MVKEKTNENMTGAGNGPEGRPSAAADRRALTDQGKLVYREKKRWGFLGLPFTFTTYLIYENDIQIKTGFLSVIENDCYMYRVIDVQLRVGFWQRLFGLGTVHCVTSDATNKTITQEYPPRKGHQGFYLPRIRGCQASQKDCEHAEYRRLRGPRRRWFSGLILCIERMNQPCAQGGVR